MKRVQATLLLSALLSLPLWHSPGFAAPQHTQAQDTPAPSAPSKQKLGHEMYEILMKSAYAGDPQSQTTLALMRIEGFVVPRNLKIARQWLGRAAIQQYAPAQFYLGRLLVWDVLNANRTDYKLQMVEGLKWLRASAQQNYPDATVLYADILARATGEYFYGHTKTEARELLMQCAQSGQSLCIDTLLAQTTDEHLKTELLIQKANAGNTQAMRQLANRPGQDHWHWIRLAARKGEPHACLELATAVLDQEQTLMPEDHALLKLFQIAAQSGLPEAQYRLGRLLLDGTRFPQNTQLGVKWLEKAARANHPGAQALLKQLNSQPAELKPEQTP